MGHLVVLPTLWVVKLRVRLAVVKSQKAAAEPQRVKLHDRGQREGVQLSESAVLVKKFRHTALLAGYGTGLTVLTPLTLLTTRSFWSKRSMMSISSSHSQAERVTY
jgi:hypothetical protein